MNETGYQISGVIYLCVVNCNLLKGNAFIELRSGKGTRSLSGILSIDAKRSIINPTFNNKPGGGNSSSIGRFATLTSVYHVEQLIATISVIFPQLSPI
jgi:hypothetical protein